MKNRKAIKFLALTSLVILLMSTYFFSPAHAEVIWTENSSMKLCPGVNLSKTAEFSTNGWNRTNMIEADLNNSSVSLDIMLPQNTGVRLPVSEFIRNSGALAGVNGSFFSWTSSGSSAVGPVVKDGKLISYMGHFNKKTNRLACIFMKNSGQVQVEYLKPQIFLLRNNRLKFIATRYNVHYTGNYGLSILDSNFMQMTPGNESFPGIVELIVSEGVMTELRVNQPAVNIPVDGFAVVATGKGGERLKEIFRQGISLTFDASPYSTKDISNPESINSQMSFKDMKFCMPAGALLVENGEPLSNFSHVPHDSPINSLNARTGLGISRDGKKIFLATIDYKSGNAKGMTLANFAKYLKNQGAWTAVNLDGGPSSTLASRIQGTNDVKIRNRTSSGARPVVNGLGIFCKIPPDGIPVGIKIKSSSLIKQNEPEKLTLLAWDKSMTPCKIDNSKITWQVNNKSWLLSSRKLSTKAEGTCTVKATYMGYSITKDFRSLSMPDTIQSQIYADTTSHDSQTVMINNNEDIPNKISDGLKNITQTLKVKKYGVTDFSNFRLIKLNVLDGGIIDFTPSQWTFLRKQIETDNNLVITLNLAPHDWKDQEEAALFIRMIERHYLKSQSNIWLVYPGDKPTIKSNNGVINVKLPSFDNKMINSFFYLRFDGKATTYGLSE